MSARSGHGRYPCPMPDIRPAVAALEADAVAMRRDLHEHAELSTEEHRTQAVITERLRAIGVDGAAIADTGVTAIVRGAGPGPNILWRTSTVCRCLNQPASPLPRRTAPPTRAATTDIRRSRSHSRASSTKRVASSPVLSASLFSQPRNASVGRSA